MEFTSEEKELIRDALVLQVVQINDDLEDPSTGPRERTPEEIKLRRKLFAKRTALLRLVGRLR